MSFSAPSQSCLLLAAGDQVDAEFLVGGGGARFEAFEDRVAVLRAQFGREIDVSIA